MRRILHRCTLFFLVILLGCGPKTGKEVQRSFYYWKSTFRLTEKERQAVSDLSVQNLFIKFFDVDWDDATQMPVPVAQVQFRDQSTVPVTPVVFITNESIRNATGAQVDELAKNITNLTNSISTSNNLKLSDELQIDCDWTEQTKEKYFRLLKQLRGQDFARHKTLSATIRLHQVKYISVTGVPPVDRGLLMCYNMGNLRHPQTKNSILDVEEMAKYVDNISDYPLPLDVALPIFDWYVWFRQNSFWKLADSRSIEKIFPSQDRIVFDKDTTVPGPLTFRAGDWLRYEGSKPSEILRAGKLLNRRIVSKKINVILYHLDEGNLDKYDQNELENFYNCFR